jgi:hypothetical protein
MHPPELIAMRRVVGALALASCAAIANAAPAIERDPNGQTQPAPTLAVEQVRVPLMGLRDEAAMVLIGTALIGLAAAVRRSA